MRTLLTSTILNLAFQAVSRQLSGIPLAEPRSVLRASFHLVCGFCVGAQGDSFLPPPNAPFPADPVPREWEAFLGSVRAKDLTSRGRLNEGAEACADAFFAGALEVFPEAKSKIFLKTLRRVWGVRMSPTKSPLAFPVSRERLEFSKEVGRHGGEQLRADYEAGALGGIGKTVLDHKLHLRNVEDYLGASGWLLGTIAFLKDRCPEWSEILARNHASVIHRAFHSGNQRYPEEAVEALPSLLQSLDLAISRWESSNPEAAQVLRANRSSVINRALHSGDLNYPGAVVKTLPGMLEAWDREVARRESSDPEIARILRANRATVISRALNGGNLNYPQEALKQLPSLLCFLDKRISRLSRSAPKRARVLQKNRGNVITRALASGNTKHAEEAVEALPRILRTLNREIARLARFHPEAARVLQNCDDSVIARALNSGYWDYVVKAAKKIPSILQTLDPKRIQRMTSDPETARILQANRASVIHRTIADGEWDYPDKVLRVLSKRPGLLAEIREKLKQIQGGHLGGSEPLEGMEALILGKALREKLLDADAACRSYLQ